MAAVDSSQKVCATCRTPRLRTEFGRLRTSPDGLFYTCRRCRRLSYTRRRDTIRAYYERTKPDHIRRAAERRARVGGTSAHIERERARRRRWRALNIEHVKRADATRRSVASASFKSKVRRNTANARARRRLAFVEHVDPMVVFVRDKWICGICHRRVQPAVVSLDHIVPLARGGLHEYANVQCAHLSCNLKKGVS